jgi:GNAT superfamily N-acetyltransferase
LNPNEKVTIQAVSSRRELNQFVRFPYSLYEGDEAWVPPLVGDYKKYVEGEGNYLNQSGPSKKIIALRDGKVCGRLLVGINQHLNSHKKLKDGYISLFECVNDQQVADSLLDYAETWLLQRGMEYVKGPLSLPGGDDNRGFLIDNFSDSTLIMNTYNKPYYPELFVKYGFQKYCDVYAYKSDSANENIKRYEKIAPYAMERYGFRVDPINLKNIDIEMKDIKRIIDKAMPTDWEDFIPPGDEEIDLIAKQLVPYADPDLIYIARTVEGEPIGFNIALPDYNEVLIKMKGHLLPFGILKYLYYKNKIRKIRFFVLFVVPEYQKKGVSSAIYWHTFRAAVKRGYDFVEGSTIWDYNEPMKRDIEKYGGEIYKTYRLYKKRLSNHYGSTGEE